MEGQPNAELMLESVRDLRKEREKLKELQNQKSEQRTTISHSDQRIARLEQQLKDMRWANKICSPDTRCIIRPSFFCFAIKVLLTTQRSTVNYFKELQMQFSTFEQLRTATKV